MNSEHGVHGLVSTVITSFNKGAFLGAAIETALQQDYVPHEILVVDDGSTDDSVTVAESFGARIRLICQENRGASGAKNRGIREARGEFVAFLDGDDRWREGKLRKQIALFRSNPRVGVVYSDELVFSDEPRKVEVGSDQGRRRRFRRGFVLDHILLDDFIGFSSAVARRDCLFAVGLMDERQRVSDDYDLWLRMARHCEFDFVDEVLVEYRAFTGGLSESSAQNLLQHVLEIQDRFVATQFNGRYPNPRLLRRATANKYEGHAGRLLCRGEHGQAARAYLTAIRHDPLSPRRYYFLMRSVIPNQLVRTLKGAFSSRSA